MTPENYKTLGSFLDSFGTLTLATHGASGPWAATLFFVHDPQLNLYFISGRNSRHVRDSLTTGRVAATINADHKEWTAIRGLQISGTIRLLNQDERPAAQGLYLQKFKDLQHVISAPSSVAERKISDNFLASDFFCIRPLTIRMIDNTKGFGHTEEFVPGCLPAPDSATCPAG